MKRTALTLIVALLAAAALAQDAPQCATDSECMCALDCLDSADDAPTPDVGSFLPVSN